MSTSSSAKNHSKKREGGRDRLKATASESGGSSQCDTPPLSERDGFPQGKFAGVGPESVQCMAEQVGAEMNSEAAANLAEDVSYKLRQMISSIALQSELMKKTRVDSWDVNSAFKLSDTDPTVGVRSTYYAQLGDEKLCYPVEELIDVSAFALTPHMYAFSAEPTLSVEWITDEKSLLPNKNISASLQNYYLRVARAILNHRKKPKEVAVADLMKNTRIGPIFPNLFNLAVLVLNDDNLNALHVPVKKPLQSNVLEMVDALCANPCSADTSIQQQRLFPVMVSNILGNGMLADRMVEILAKIARTWPTFIGIGKGILFEYLAQGTEERLNAPMIKCVTALGRRALIDCLGDYLEFIDDTMHIAPITDEKALLRLTVLDASQYLLRSEPTTYLEDFVSTDYAMYEMLGDSIMPSRTLFPKKEKTSPNGRSTGKPDEEPHYGRYSRKPRLRYISTMLPLHNGYKQTVFEPITIQPEKPYIRIKVKCCRALHVRRRVLQSPAGFSSHSSPGTRACDRGVVVAGGLLHRFRYKPPQIWKPLAHLQTFML